MASTINASTAGGGGIISSADSSGVLQLQTGGTAAVTVNASQNVGIGTASPGAKLQVIGDIVANNLFFGTTTSSAGTLSSDNSGTGGYIQCYGTTSSQVGAVVVNAGGSGYISLATSATERIRIDGTGNVSVTQSPGKYTVDTAVGATVIANGGTVDFPNASGMLIVNNYAIGAVTIWLCGGGNTNSVSNVGGVVGSFAYVSGINGYRWTNNFGSTTTFGFFFVRTRTFS